MHTKYLIVCVTLCSMLHQLHCMEQSLETTLKELDTDLSLSAHVMAIEDTKFAWVPQKVELIITNPDINATDDLGNTRLHYAALLGMVPEMIQYFNLRADPTIVNAQGQDPLMVLDNVIAQKKETDPQIYQNLINEYHELLSAFIKKSSPQFKNILLIRAITAEDVELVQKLLDAGADPKARNEWGQTPLHYAILHFNSPLSKNIVDVLLNKGANPDAVTQEQQTPLHLLLQDYIYHKAQNTPAFNDKILTTLKALFDLMKNKNPQDKRGNTPLYMLVAQLKDTNVDEIKFIKNMLIAGANPNIQNKEGYTPLHAAVLQHNADLVTLLIEYHANPFMCTFQPRTQTQIQEKIPPLPGKTALQIAMQLRDTKDIPLVPMLKIEATLKKAEKSYRVPPAVQPKIEEQKPAASALINELENLTQKLQGISRDLK